MRKGKLFDTVLGDVAADVTAFPAHLVRQMMVKTANIEKVELCKLEVLGGIVLDAQIRAYHKVVVLH